MLAANDIEQKLNEAAAENRALENRALAKRVGLSLLLILLFLFALIGAWRESSFDAAFEPLDTRAKNYLENALTKSAITYGAVRGVHAVIAIFKGTQVHPPFVTLAIGEALDPVQDLIERFSDVLLLAIASLGAQLFLMQIGQWVGVQVFVAAGCALLFAGLWVKPAQKTLYAWGARAVVFGLAVRLMIPLIACFASASSEALLSERYNEANAQMELGQDALAQNVLPEQQSGFWDKIKGWTNTDALAKHIEQFKRQAENLAKSMITLFTLFVFETIVFPLFSLWILTRIFSGMLRLQ